VILYVNGDSHSAAAEAAVPYCFAQDDSLYYALGRIPHPENERVSYGCNLANQLHAILHIDAESASSNARIIRTTYQYLKDEGTPDAIVIGWATWEREEWLHNNQYYQVTAGGTDMVPDDLMPKYKEWVITAADRYAENEIQQHETIWQFHNMLKDLSIPHLFFNTYSCFAHIRQNGLAQYDWGDNYVDPYAEESTYYTWLKQNGCDTVNPNSYHFGADAHDKWADFLYPRLTQLL
jgi:hypothetical protein